MPEISPAAMKFLRQRVNLRHLRLVLVLDEERSITRTAERLCISQAAVSKTRAEFEKGIGAPLFEWFGNRLEVTPLGKCVLQSARRILAELECLSDEFAQMSSGMRGVLSIGSRTISGQPFLSRVTAGFKAAHPAVTVELLDLDMASLMERLAKGSISLLFGRYDATFAGAKVEAHAILSDRSVVLASPTHPLAHRRKLTWSELVSRAWALTPDGYNGRFSREYLSAHLSQQQLPFPPDLIETQSLLLILTLFQAGDFLTLLPEGVALHVASRGLGHVLDLEPVGPPDSLCMMWRSDLPMPPAARHFRDLAMQLLKSEGGHGDDLEQLPASMEAKRFEMVERPPRHPRKRQAKRTVAHARASGSARR
jgi:LysR family transcriptional regulator, pca operon transcriptional activator